MAGFKQLAAALRAAWFPGRATARPPQRRQPQPAREPRPLPAWRMSGCGVQVHAATKSEARAALKRALGLRRLPPGATIEPV